MQLWFIYALVFGAVLFAVQGIYWLITRGRMEVRAINRRLALSGGQDSQMEVLEILRRERGLAGSNWPMFGGLRQLLTQTGLRIDARRVLLYVALLGMALLAIFNFTLGFGLLSLTMAVVLTLVIVYLALLYIRHRRIQRFGEQLPDALDVIVRGLRAGHPFRVALGLVSRELADPIGTEFGILSDEITYGLDIDTAMDNLMHRVGHDDLAFFSISVTIQNQTGGNLAEVLWRLSQLVRSRIKLRLKVRAITSEGRLSAIFLSLAPFILFSVINLISPAYFGYTYSHPITIPALVGGLLLLGAGNLIMYRMVNFKI